jgi:hypothetical protein
MLETRRCCDNGPFVQRVPEPLADRLGSNCRGSVLSLEFALDLGYRVLG